MVMKGPQFTLDERDCRYGARLTWRECSANRVGKNQTWGQVLTKRTVRSFLLFTLMIFGVSIFPWIGVSPEPGSPGRPKTPEAKTRCGDALLGWRGATAQVEDPKNSRRIRFWQRPPTSLLLLTHKLLGEATCYSRCFLGLCWALYLLNISFRYLQWSTA